LQKAGGCTRAEIAAGGCTRADEPGRVIARGGTGGRRAALSHIESGRARGGARTGGSSGGAVQAAARFLYVRDTPPGGRRQLQSVERRRGRDERRAKKNRQLACAKLPVPNILKT